MAIELPIIKPRFILNHIPSAFLHFCLNYSTFFQLYFNHSTFFHLWLNYLKICLEESKCSKIKKKPKTQCFRVFDFLPFSLKSTLDGPGYIVLLLEAVTFTMTVYFVPVIFTVMCIGWSRVSQFSVNNPTIKYIRFCTILQQHKSIFPVASPAFTSGVRAGIQTFCSLSNASFLSCSVPDRIFDSWIILNTSLTSPSGSLFHYD